MSDKIITESFAINLTINEVDFILNSLCKYDVKEAKLFFDSISPFLISKRKHLTPENFVSLLYCISKYNLIDVYDMHPLYIEFLFSYETKKFRNEIKQNLPKILFFLANFTLRTKDFNPLFKEIILLLPQYLKDNSNLSDSFSENLENILLSLAVVELSMKYDLTNVDFEKYFTAELVGSLLNLYFLKMKNDGNLKRFVENFGIEKISYEDSNLTVFYNLKYKDDLIPVILLNNSDYNIDGKFVGSVYIKYFHLKSYLQNAPMVLNVDKVKTNDDLAKEVSAYWRNRNGAYKTHLI